MWNKNPHSPSGKWRRQNLDRVNIFRPIKPSVFHTTEAKPWCVWLPRMTQAFINDSEIVEREVAGAYMFPDHFHARQFVMAVFELKLRERTIIERYLNFYGGEPC